MKKNAQPIIFFDGVCAVCNHIVDFIITRDHEIFLYAPLQGTTAQQQLSPDLVKGELKTLVLVDEEGVHTQFQAIQRIFSGLGWPWRLIIVLRCLPLGLLNWAYSFFATHRYRWFGRYDVCRLPRPEESVRFLD